MALKQSDITTSSGLTPQMTTQLQDLIYPSSTPTPRYYNQKEFDSLGFVLRSKVEDAQTQAQALAPNIAASYASNAKALTSATSDVEHTLGQLQGTITQLNQSMKWSTLASNWLSDGSEVKGQDVEQVVPSLVFGASIQPSSISTQGSVAWLSKNGVCTLPLPATPEGCSFCAWERDCTMQCACAQALPKLDLATCILQDTSWLKGECGFLGSSDTGKGLTCYAPLPNFHGTKKPVLTVQNVGGNLQCTPTKPPTPSSE